MRPRLFHFSSDANIAEFVPRPVRVPARRAPADAWLNGPLVWAIDDWHQPLYFFPRECPRILLWETDTTTAEDRTRHFANGQYRMLAYVEAQWLRAIEDAAIYRYALPAATFESLHDAGMWVSKSPVRAHSMKTVGDLPAALCGACVELRTVSSLTSLDHLWHSSLHVSGLRLRNAGKAPSSVKTSP